MEADFYSEGDSETKEPPDVLCDITLSFSEEEWLGLTAWQKELYVTVMKDTMELVTSLGYMMVKPGVFAKCGTAVCKSLMAHERRKETVITQSTPSPKYADQNYTTQATDRATGHHGTERSSAHRCTDTAMDYQDTDRSTGHQTTDTATSYQGTDRSSARHGTDRSSAHQGTDRSSAHQGTDRSSAHQGTERSSAHHGTDRSSDHQGTERSSDHQGTDRSSAHRGTDRSSAHRGTERSSAHHGTDRSSAHHGTDRSSAHHDTDRSSAHRGTVHHGTDRSSAHRGTDRSSAHQGTELATGPQSTKIFLMCNSKGEHFPDDASMQEGTEEIFINKSTKGFLIRESSGECFISQSSESPHLHESTEHIFNKRCKENSVICESTREIFINKSTEGFLVCESKGDSFMSQATNGSLIHENTGTNLINRNIEGSQSHESAEKSINPCREQCLKEEPVDRSALLHTEASPGVEHDMVIDRSSDPGFLQVIKVEERDGHLLLETTVKTLEGAWETPVDYSNDVHGCSNQSALERQEVGVFPLALLTSVSQYPLIGQEGVLVQQWENTTQLDSNLLPSIGGETYWAMPINKDMETVDCKTGLEDTDENMDSYSCSMCSKNFLNKLHLEVHERDHGKYRLFSAPRCDKQQSHKHYMLRHRQSHQAELPASQEDPSTTGDNDFDQWPTSPYPTKKQRRFLCKECGRRFTQRVGLLRHQKTHIQSSLGPKPVAPPPRKIYRLPVVQAKGDGKNGQEPACTEEACSELHRNLQLSTVFLQKLITSTGCFQYD